MLKFFVLCLFGALTCPVVAQTCETLSNSTMYKMRNPCARIVDYPFFVPADQSAASLETNALSRLNSANMLLFPTSCTEALVEFICSTVYNKCQPGINFADMATWNFAVYAGIAPMPIPVPVQR